MNKADKVDIATINDALAALPIPQPQLQPHEYALAVTDYRTSHHREMTPFGGLLVLLVTALIALATLIGSLPSAVGGILSVILIILLGAALLAALLGVLNRMLMSSKQAARVAVQAVLVRRQQTPNSSR